MADVNGSTPTADTFEPADGENIDGPLRFKVTPDADRAVVHIDLSRSVDWLCMAPAQAREIARMIRVAADAVDDALGPKL